jgi:far upstream element-binding protein
MGGMMQPVAGAQGGGYAVPGQQMMMMAPMYGGGAPAVNPMAAVGGGGPTTSIEVPCAGCEGRIIGKGGDMIKYLQSVTGAKLDMKRDVGTVMMTGSPEAVQAAQELVLEVMELGDTRSKGGLIPKFGGAAAQQQQMMMVPMQGQGYAPAPGGYAMMPAQPQQGYAQPEQYTPQPVQYDYSQAQPGAAAAAYGQQPQQAQPGEHGAAYVPQPAQHAAVAAAEWGQQQQQQQPAAAAAADAGVGAGAGAGAGAAGAATAAGEWQTHYSEGRAYYYNTVTGETRWA